eukprot:1142734-Pelagomonas_calceolata.AAC.7
MARLVESDAALKLSALLVETQKYIFLTLQPYGLTLLNSAQGFQLTLHKFGLDTGTCYGQYR